MEIDDDNYQIKGEAIDEVSSEITEIMKLERFVGTPEEQCDNKVELIKKYSRALYFIAEEREADMENDKIIGEVDALLKLFHKLPEEEIISDQEYLDDRYVHVLTISNDPKTKKTVPDDMFQQVYESMERKIDKRRLNRLSKIANKLALMLSSEFDLHRDMTYSEVTQEDFEGDYFDE